MSDKILVDRKTVERVIAAMLETRTASIEGCNEGYGKPERWADRLYRSHGGLTDGIKSLERLLNDH